MKTTTTTTKVNQKKENAINAMYDYLDYAQKNNCNVKPTKTVNSGNKGNAFERLVKLSLNNYRFKGTSQASQLDTKKKINNINYNFEVKSGCGELATLDEKGNILKSNLLKSNYVIYTPFVQLDIPVIEYAYILPVNTFMNILKECNLIRYKMSSSQYQKPIENRYVDRMTIATFNNSKTKSNLFIDLLEEHSQILGDFLKENNINGIII